MKLLRIGKKAKRVLEKDAQDYIFGYYICNDVSERECQKEKGGQWVKGKFGDIVTIGTILEVGLGMNPPFILKDGDKMNLTVDNLGSKNTNVVAE
jgi:2,4-diketo-3-deoxy-L-fuconate hydrolase|tara:strand:+ start:446 stop:730 length:285 start_codon:yes stop_codon:yes gene_type:complete